MRSCLERGRKRERDDDDEGVRGSGEKLFLII
jgi:hypothetical protein